MQESVGFLLVRILDVYTILHTEYRWKKIGGEEGGEKFMEIDQLTTDPHTLI